MSDDSVPLTCAHTISTVCSFRAQIPADDTVERRTQPSCGSPGQRWAFAISTSEGLVDLWFYPLPSEYGFDYTGDALVSVKRRKTNTTTFPVHFLTAEKRQPLGRFGIERVRSDPLFEITVTFPGEFDVQFLKAVRRMTEAVIETVHHGQDLTDVKFYLYTRRTGTTASHPRVLFAKTRLLTGYSDYIDTCEQPYSILTAGHNQQSFISLVLLEEGFDESSLVNINEHTIAEASAVEYDYESDSDLDDYGE